MNRFFLCILTLIVSILSINLYSKTVVALATDNDFEAIGLSSTKTEFPGGTVIVNSEVGSMELAYTDSWGLSRIPGGYNTVKVGDSGNISLGNGAVGNTNPAFTSYEKGVMSAGAVFKIKAKQDGWMTVFTKMNPSKQYIVFEGSTGAIPYTLGVAGDGYKINYNLPVGDDGYIDFGASDASKYFTHSLSEEGVVLGNKPEFPYIVAGLENSLSQSTGFLTFKVYAGRDYYVSALGSKMICGGFVFSDSKQEPAVTFAATDNLPQVTFGTRPSDEPVEETMVPTPTAIFNNKLLTLSCSDSQAQIRYAIDGEPSAASDLYVSPLSLTTDCTVKFFAMRQGYKDSEKATFLFRKSDYQVAKPTINYNSESGLISITCQTESVEIRYTTNGNEPTKRSGTVYNGPFAVTGNITYIARAFRSDLFDSESASVTVGDLQVPKPTATFSNKLLTLSCSDANARIRYTSDGSDPTMESTLYESPLSLTSDCVVKFFASREGYKDSEIESFNFFKSNYQVAKPSITFDSNSRLLSISCPTEGAQIRYTTDGSEPTSSSILYTGAIAVESNINFGARGFKEGLFDSEVTYFSTTIEQVEIPTASFSSKKLTLSCADPKDEIFYTIVGLNSAKEWSLYDKPLELKDDCTINFYAKRDGYNDSETASFEFILAEHQVSLPILENDFRGRKITITHPESLPVKVTIDGITEEMETPVIIDVSTSMTSIAAIAVATDENLYDSNATREDIKFHKKPVVTYNGHTLTVSVAKDDPIKADAEVVCNFNNSLLGQNSQSFTTDISEFGNVTAKVQSNEAFYSADAELSIDAFNTGRVAGARNSHRLSETFGTWNDNEEDYTYLRIVGEVNKEDLQLLATLPNLTTLHLDHSQMTGEKCDNIFADSKIETLYFANSFPQGLLLGMPRLTTVMWGSTDYKMTPGRLSEAANPNILLWVTKSNNAPEDANNIVIFQDPGYGKATDPLVSDVQGTAEKITLQAGYPFNVHKPIKVAEINMEKDFTLPTEKGVTQGWETLILPFAPKVIRHETKGNLVAFKAWDSTNVDAKPFWLYKATENGWEEADALNACEPYVISMPNNPIYMDAFNLAGKVTFSAENIVLSPESMDLEASPWVNSIEFAGTFMPVEEPNILSLNVNASNEGEFRGSAFVDYDMTLPFGAYVRNVGDMKRIPLFGEGSGVELPSFESESIKIETPAPGTLRLYSSYRLKVSIYTSTGVMVRSVNLAPGEPAEIENLTKGIYICNGVKVMVD